MAKGLKKVQCQDPLIHLFAKNLNLGKDLYLKKPILNKEVKRLCNLSLKELHKNYIDTKDILLYNFEHFKKTKERIDITL